MANSNNNPRGSNYLACEDSDEVFQMFCEICHQKGVKNVTADGFCINCLQYFCGNCLGFHKIFLPEHKHLDKYEMPQDLCSEFCQDHHADLLCFYCKSCDTFICRTCKTTTHQECKEVLFLPDEVADFENTRDFKVFERVVADLETELKEIKLSLDEDNKNIANIHQQAVKAIEDQREEMLTKFDHMKKDLEDTFQKTLNNDRNRLDVVKKKLDSLSNNYRETKRQIHTLKESGQRCKLYMTMKQLTSKLNSLTDDLEQINGREPMTQYQYKPDQSFMDLVQAHKFGYTVINQKNESEKQTCQLAGTETVNPKQAKHQLLNSKETKPEEFQSKCIKDTVTAIENQPERSRIGIKGWLLTKDNEESAENNRTQDKTKDNQSRLRLLTNIPKKHRRKAEKQAVKEERERRQEEKKHRKEEENEIQKQEKEQKEVNSMLQVIFRIFLIIITLLLVVHNDILTTILLLLILITVVCCFLWFVLWITEQLF